MPLGQTFDIEHDCEINKISFEHKLHSNML